MSTIKVLCGVILLVGASSFQSAAAQAASSGDRFSRGATVEMASSNTLDSLAARGANAVEPSSVSGPDASVAAPAIVAVPPPLHAKNTSPDNRRVLPFSRIAISTRTGTLGIGGQIATPLTRWLNLRGGVDFFNFGYGFAQDGATYNGQLHLKSGLVSLDWFPLRYGFHVSPGVLIFKSRVAASLFVPGGNTFSLGDTDFTSGPSDPVSGNASIAFSRSVMPALTFGFGNMIPREGRHWSVPFEIGAAYTGHYTSQLTLAGSACTQGFCRSTSDPTIQQSVAQEQSSLNEAMKHYQIYPILTTGVSYKF
jgi:hypothetical protein